MPRVTPTEVKELITVSISGSQISPFIKAANVIINQVLASSGLPADHLKEIERWLSAHFVAVSDPRVSQAMTGKSSATFEGKSGMGLDFTRYGQQVKVLDTTGLLSSTLGQEAASFAVVDRDEIPTVSDTGM